MTMKTKPHHALLLAATAGITLARTAQAQPEAPVAEAPPEPAAPAPAEAPPPTEEPTPTPDAAPAEAAAAEPTPVEAAPAPAGAPPSPEAAPAPAGAPPSPEPVPAPPEPPPADTAPETPAFLPLSVGGSIWSRYEMRKNYHDHGLTHPRLAREGDYIVSRARLKLATNPVDVGSGVKVSGTFVPQAAYTMGENTGANPTVSDHPNLQIYEGFASVGTQSYKLDVGRFMLDYGDALTIGNLGWNESARSFNGARMRITPGGSKYYIDLLGTLINDGRAQSLKPISGDTYFYGVYAGLGPLLGEGIDLDVYALAKSVNGMDGYVLEDPTDPTVTVPGERAGATELTLGSRVKGNVSLLDYRAEAGVQFGKSSVEPTFAAPTPSSPDHLAFQIDGELGVSPVKPFRVGVEGLYASGDDLSSTGKNEGFDQLYPTAHKFLGLMDITGARTNVASAVLHLKYAVAEPVALLLDAHYFTRPQAGPDGKDGSVGSEIDTQIKYAIGGGFLARGLYGVFLPTEDYWSTKALTPNDAGTAMHYVEVQVGYDFK